MEKITITLINCNQGHIQGGAKIMLKLYKQYSIKHPNAFQIMRFSRGKNPWDGIIHYISDTGKFKIGLLGIIVKDLKSWGCKINIIDERPSFRVDKIPSRVGNYTLREEQYNALEKLLSNKINGIPFYIGVGDLAVNFGKSLLFAALYESFGKRKTILLTNDADWFNQAKREFPDNYISSSEITFVRGNGVMQWENFTIAMVQSVARNIKDYRDELTKVQVVLIDEADIIDNKTYKTVIQHLYNAPVRFGLSGTIYLSKLKKHLVKNMNIRSFIGDKLAEVKLHEMIDAGYSTPVTVKMLELGCPFNIKDDRETYKEEYDRVVSGKPSIKLTTNRVIYNITKNRLPILVVCKNIEHCENLHEFIRDSVYKLNHDIKVDYIHHDIKNRKDIIEQFRIGKIDILISTTIIARGKNIPLVKCLINVSAMDSNEKVIQILGRLVRTHESKKQGIIEDLMFEGNYLGRHSRHRLRYYKSEKLTVIKIPYERVLKVYNKLRY